MSQATGDASRFQPWVFDVVLTVALLAGGIGGLFWYAEISTVEFLAPDLLGVLLVVVVTVPLLLRRRAPVVTGFVVALAAASFIVWNYSVPTVTVVMLVAVYSAGAYARLAPALAVVAAMAAASTAYVLTADEGAISRADAIPNVIISFLAFVVVWGVGRVVQTRRLYTADLEVRNERLERATTAEIRAALAEERSRIARELHDVVAHHVSVMTVQAAGARRAIDRDPDSSAEALRAIESTGRSALSEMRRIVGVLRGPDDPDDASRAGRSPAPRLVDVDALADHLRGTGLPVEVSIAGEPRPLPASVELTAYRVVQEALTNTIKHAGPSKAEVHIRYQPGTLEVTISDDGRGLATALEGRGPGHGLLGMRERVALYGGTLSVGPRPGGGFEVRARIPYEPPAV